MDYDAIDRNMSSYLVACDRNGTRFYLTDDGTASDIRKRAAFFRWMDQADKAATLARTEYAWNGFNWQPVSVAEEWNR